MEVPSSLSPADEQAYRLHVKVTEAENELFTSGSSSALQDYLSAISQGNHFFNIISGDVIYLQPFGGAEQQFWVVSVNLAQRTFLVSPLSGQSGQHTNELKFDELLSLAETIDHIDKLHQPTASTPNWQAPAPVKMESASRPKKSAAKKSKTSAGFVSMPALERVFGANVVKMEDMDRISEEVTQLIHGKSPFTAYAAAQQFVYLKRAGIRITQPEYVAQVYRILVKHREEMRQFGVKVMARYLTYLKYLGAIQAIDPVEQSVIVRSMLERSSDPKPGRRSSLFFAQAKYLGVATNNQGIGTAVLKELQHDEKSGDAGRLLAGLARLKCLGLLPGEVKALGKTIALSIPEKMNTYSEGKKWDEGVRLSLLYNFITGEATLSSSDKALLVGHMEAMRTSGQAHPWRLFTRYISLLASLARQIEKKQIDQNEFGYLGSEPFQDADPTEYLQRAGEVEKAALQKKFVHTPDIANHEE